MLATPVALPVEYINAMRPDTADAVAVGMPVSPEVRAVAAVGVGVTLQLCAPTSQPHANLEHGPMGRIIAGH